MSDVRQQTGGEWPGHEFLERLEFWLDRGFRLPGTSFRFGFDGLLGLIPGVGDTATALVSGALMTHAYRIGARRRAIAAMAKNVAVDWAIGLVPLVGDVFDFAHKANTKNIRILRAEQARIAADRPLSYRAAALAGKPV